jgi:CubicO group peptidase (beta-lactamase class C family)
VGEPLESFASENLFQPTGITDYQWLSDATGGTVGGQNLRMRPRDMAKLGWLYLQEGRWDDGSLSREIR